MECIRFSLRMLAGSQRSPFIAFGLVTVLAGGYSPKLFAAPQGIGEQGQEQSAQVQPQMEHETGLLALLATLIEEPEKNDLAIMAAESAATGATHVGSQASAFREPHFALQQFSASTPRPFARYTNSEVAFIGLGGAQRLSYPRNLKLHSEVAEQPREGQAQASSNVTTALAWESRARLHHGLERTSGTLILSPDGVVFRPTKGTTLHWPFLEIQTFDLLSPRRLAITGYENRSWHGHGERKYRFDLTVAMPPDIAAELALRVAKPVRNADPNPTATSFAEIPARHRTLAGGTNGTLHFGPDGIDYLTTNGQGERSWRWSDVQTLAKPDPFQLRVNSYRETFTFELKQPMSRELFDRLWDEIYAHDLNGSGFSGSKKNP